MMMEACLKRIASILNEHNVVWALGASMLLHYKGLAEKPNDIDILVSMQDAQRSDELLSQLGYKYHSNPNDNYASKLFCEYMTDGIKVDLISGFTITQKGEAYEYVLDEGNFEYLNLDCIRIPLTPLEDWYALYSLMPGCQNKAELIENYFIERLC